MRVLVVGAAGHLGSAVARYFAPSADVTATTRADLDVRDHRAVEATVTRVAPDVVINCSAYTDVDRAEDEPAEALEVNAFAVKRLAATARAAGAAFVHYSTDFVFDGTADRPYTEEDEPNPRSTYACSKLIGEWFAREAGRHYVLRVESVFGSLAPSSSPRRTSVDRILDAILEGREARVFVDRTVSPSYSADVARATQALLERRAPDGLYHCVSSGSCTWEALARRGGPAAEHRAAPGSGPDGGRRAAGRAPALLRPRERQAGRGGRDHAELAGRARAVPAGTSRAGRPSLTAPLGEPYNSRSRATTPTRQEAHVEARHHHRNHRPGRVVSRRAAAREGLRGHRRRPALERAEPVAHRAPARPHHAPAGRPARPAVADRGHRRRPPGTSSTTWRRCRSCRRRGTSRC